MRFLSRGGRSLVPSPEHHGPKSRLEPPIPPSANRPSPKFIFPVEGRSTGNRHTVEYFRGIRPKRGRCLAPTVRLGAPQPSQDPSPKVDRPCASGAAGRKGTDLPCDTDCRFPRPDLADGSGGCSSTVSASPSDGGAPE